MKRLRIALISFGALLVFIVLVFLLYIFFPAPKNPNAHLPNSYPVFEQMLNPNADLNTRLSLLPELLNYEYFEIPQKPQYLEHSVYLDSQIQNKVIYTKSTFFMMEGKKEKALELLSANYHATWLWGQRNRGIDQAIVNHQREIIRRGLKNYLFNSCNSEEELDNLIAALNKTGAIMRSPNIGAIRQREIKDFSIMVLKDPKGYFTASKDVRKMASRWMGPEFIKGVKLFFASDVYDHNKLLAYAYLKKHLIKTGEVAENPDEVKKILPAEVYNALLKQVKKNAPKVFPITIIKQFRYELEKESVFNKEKIKSFSKEELIQLFTNDLFKDVFEISGSLSVSETEPLYIYSVGPDLEGPDYDDILKQPIAYDPTNGLTSKGDIFMFVGE